MRVIFVNRFYRPDSSATSQILTTLAESLALAGIDVCVITSRQLFQHADAALPKHERIADVEVWRVWSTSFGRATRLRALDYFTFYLTALAKSICLCKRSDILVAKTDPPMLSVPLAVAANIKHAQLVNWLQDLFPEIAIRLNVPFIQGRLGRILIRVRNWSLKRASQNVCIGTEMAKAVADIAGGKTVVIPNWADGREIQPIPRHENSLRQKWGLNDKFVLGYSGNMGRVHELETILRAAARIRHRDDVAFLFVGDGNQRKILEERANSAGLTNVFFQPHQPQENLPLALSLPDAHFVTLRPEMEGLVVPSKLYGVMAAGRPIIFIGDPTGEVAQVICSGQPCGMVAAPGNVDELVSHIEHLIAHPSQVAAMGVAARRLFESNYDITRSVDSWRRAIGRVQAASEPA